jgi:flagellar basal body-associated protein FliL
MTRKKILFICSASTIAVTLCATVTGVTLVQKNKMHTKDSPDQKPSNFEK